AKESWIQAVGLPSILELGWRHGTLPTRSCAMGDKARGKSMGVTVAILWWLFMVALSTGASADPADDQSTLAKALASLSRDRMLADVTRLSAPDFNGRQTGTEDDLRSGLFVAERFQSLGFLPACSQPFSVMPGGPFVGPQAVLSQPWMVAETLT